MAEIIDIRNPKDLVATYNQIEIRGSAASDMSAPTTLTSSTAIDTSQASDLSTGYTSYLDATGYAYYQFRYKNSGSGAVSAWSDIYAAGTTVMHVRFRRKMRDTNAQNYFFTDADISAYLQNSIYKLWPHTYNEVIDESLATSATTYKYAFPQGIQRVNDIEYIDSQGNVSGHPNGWSIRAKQLIFDFPPISGYTFRLYADKQFQKLAEVPEVLDDLILDLMRLQAYEDMEADRSTYYRYTTVIAPEGGNLPSISKIIERLSISNRIRLNSLRRVRRASDIRMVR